MTTEQPFRPEVVPGDRIFLSHPMREDLPLFARWFADPELNTYLGNNGGSFTYEQEEEWYNNRTKDVNARNLAIIVREDQRIIGTVTLMNINFLHGRSEIGIAIGDKTAWGKGYGSKAMRLMCDYGFTFLNLHTIYLWHTSFNERGHQAYLKAGFREVGRLRGVRVLDGKRYDDVLMDITRDDFGPTTLTKLIGQLNTDI